MAAENKSVSLQELSKEKNKGKKSSSNLKGAINKQNAWTKHNGNPPM